MLRMLAYLFRHGVVTSKVDFPDLAPNVQGVPRLSESPCESSQGCTACQDICPTSAIKLESSKDGAGVSLDLGACIACGLCVPTCPSGTIVEQRSTRTASNSRRELVLSTGVVTPERAESGQTASGIFSCSIALRVVSTGCSACDLEVSAITNPMFDAERLGIHIVASPRFADALLVTGPVPKAMHEALSSCYEAMSEPRLVIAVGTCAISGGVHRGGYAEANGAAGILPVDVFVPGCPPNPWSIIHGIQLARQAKISAKEVT